MCTSSIRIIGVLSLVFTVVLGSPIAPADTSRPIVVELFTSQGCSSCPPADAYLGELAARDDVIALSLPVDYWDYLGWKDTLATPAFTQRQRAYAHRLNLRSVYTPQIVVDGVTDAVGSRRGHVERAIELRGDMLGNARVPVTFAQAGTAIAIRVGAGEPPKDEATLWLVRYNRATTVEIERGENAGNTFTYANVVRELTPIGMWNGDPLEMKLPKASLSAPGYDGCAVILQEDGPGPVLGAARLDMTWLSAGVD